MYLPLLSDVCSHDNIFLIVYFTVGSQIVFRELLGKDWGIMHFTTDYKYVDRETKAKYVWLKYESILRGSQILDVGADECHLKQYIDEHTTYWGIGLGGHPDQQIDLENEILPFEDNKYDVVLCLDVLEHIETIYRTFDELCRVSRQYVIISLPNPWSDFYSMMRHGEYDSGQPLKYYGIPLEKPTDRHKWFFSIEEAERFIISRAKKNGMSVIQMDSRVISEGWSLRGVLKRIARKILLRGISNTRNLYSGTLWAVLEKEDSANKV